MTRKYNFSAGPGVLPEKVLKQAQAEMLDWNGSGMSVMEMSHRGSEFISIAQAAESDLRKLLKIPENYKVLFLQGGASLQFSAVPMNLGFKKSVAYVDSGIWSSKAISEAKKYSDVTVVASAKASGYKEIPDVGSWTKGDFEYLHYTPNETIGGLEFPAIPEVSATLVADYSSTILSRPIDVSKFGVIYAGAQKNIGQAGLTIVIVRDDLIKESDPSVPTMLSYKIQSENESMYNTPSCYAWYIAGLVFKHLLDLGGLEKIAEINERKAKKLYDYIDQSNYYKNPIKNEFRSWMNVPFTLPNENLDKPFLKEADAKGLSSLKGHRSVGGMRASIYNAMPEEGIDALIEFMEDFRSRNENV